MHCGHGEAVMFRDSLVWDPLGGPLPIAWEPENTERL